jgi:hypothetical protein
VNAAYPYVARRASHRCEYCRAPEVVFNFTFEVEHITPTSRGGSDEKNNLALACRACNAHKSNVFTGTDPETGMGVPLFNPRSNHWDEHFQFDPDSDCIRGLTPVGRATVERLDMNNPLQLLARSLWIQFRLYP